jgi:hypothetical protein
LACPTGIEPVTLSLEASVSNGKFFFAFNWLAFGRRTIEARLDVL